MKNKLYFLLIAIFTISAGYFNNLSAKEIKKSEAVLYMEEMGKHATKIKKDLWLYITASAHTNNIKIINKKRKNLIRSVEKSITKVKKIKPFKGDKDYKEGVLKYFEMMHIILKKDYAKIVDMKEVAEQSYDLMEAYLLAQEKANEKLQQAFKELENSEKKFAEKNNVNLIESKEDEITKNLLISGKVMDYYKKIYLIFFKSYKQELYVIDSVKRSDISKIEQNRKTLKKYSSNGLDKLQEIKAFQEDSSLKNSCQEMLSFYKDESSKKMAVATDFFMKQEKFKKIKKTFDLKKKSERTKEDVDLYNEKVNEMNKAADQFNKVNKELFQKRKKLLNNWNNQVKAFFSAHVPK